MSSFPERVLCWKPQHEQKIHHTLRNSAVHAVICHAFLKRTLLVVFAKAVINWSFAAIPSKISRAGFLRLFHSTIESQMAQSMVWTAVRVTSSVMHGSCRLTHPHNIANMNEHGVLHLSVHAHETRHESMATPHKNIAGDILKLTLPPNVENQRAPDFPKKTNTAPMIFFEHCAAQRTRSPLCVFFSANFDRQSASACVFSGILLLEW